MRVSSRIALLAAVALCACIAPVRAQLPFDVAALLQDVDTGITQMSQNMLADKRVAELKDQGLIVGPLLANLPEGAEEDAFRVFINNWALEKMMTAMIKLDEDAHFAVVDRLMMENAMRSLKLDAGALRDPKNWPALGEAVDANYLLTGSYSVLPVREAPLEIAISVTARIVNLDTAKAVAAGSFDLIFKQAAPPAGG